MNFAHFLEYVLCFAENGFYKSATSKLVKLQSTIKNIIFYIMEYIYSHKSCFYVIVFQRYK
jgi:hypothetical protein